MRRRAALALLGGVAATGRVASLTAWAQVPAKPHRVAFVVSTTPVAQITEADHSLFRVFLDELRKLGHIEGHNLIIERHSGEGRFDQFPDLARKVVQTNPEVIVAITERVAHAFKAATYYSGSRYRERSGSQARRTSRAQPEISPGLAATQGLRRSANILRSSRRLSRLYRALACWPPVPRGS